MIFKENNTDTDRLDYAIMRDGAVSLYYKKSVLHSDLEWFEKERYNVISFDCSKWGDEKIMHEQFKEKLYFPDYYGMNFNALKSFFIGQNFTFPTVFPTGKTKKAPPNCLGETQYVYHTS